MGVNFTTKGHLKVVFRVVTAAVLLASLSINSTGEQRIQQYSPVQVDQRVLEQQRVQQLEQQRMLQIEQQRMQQQLEQQIEQQRMQQQLEQQRRQQLEQQRMQQQRMQQMQPQQQSPSSRPQVNQGALETLRRIPPLPDVNNRPDGIFRQELPSYPPVSEPAEHLAQTPRPSRPHSGCTRQ